ncbi:sensor histidine kinase [Actinoplanes sp. CA-015351]|uniref:sensor histidine kinase n=1 Tax=Actinoplanes sp. CA-015351 TaxID=3239897 RepID=UPI003D9534B6
MFRLRRGTVSARFTILYASVFLGSGATLLALAFLLSGVEVTSVAPTGSGGPLPAVQQDRQLMTSAATALLMMAGVSLVMGRILAGRVLRPLRSITVATRRITAESLDHRLAVAGPADEVKDLADTIDGLLERLEASFAAQRRFVANASHELRTPLATMRASLDVAAAKPDPPPATMALAGRLRSQLDRVDHLLDGFLVLARAQHGVLADAEIVDLGDLVATALRQRASDVRAKHLTVTMKVPPGTATHGSPALLARLVENVIDNAVRHNEDHGWIRASGVHDTGTVTLTVETGGPPLDQRDVERLAQPFERLNPSQERMNPNPERLSQNQPGSSQNQPGLSPSPPGQSPSPPGQSPSPPGQCPDQPGPLQPATHPHTTTPVRDTDTTRVSGSSGLGLSIVAAVATAHGGRLDLAARPTGGLRVRVTLVAP